MKLLLDTQCWLWGLLEPERLSPEAFLLLENSSHDLYLSAASSWEIAIKTALGKLKLPQAPEIFVPSRMAAQGIAALAISHAHALRVHDLPHHHRDPFDRILVAQAQLEKLTLLTADRIFASYDVPILWAAG
jgi:PIN domain nuclease of toxin-antitoxin system